MAFKWLIAILINLTDGDAPPPWLRKRRLAIFTLRGSGARRPLIYAGYVSSLFWVKDDLVLRFRLVSDLRELFC